MAAKPYLHTTEIDFLKNIYKTIVVDPTATGTIVRRVAHGINVDGIEGPNGLFTVVKVGR